MDGRIQFCSCCVSYAGLNEANKTIDKRTSGDRRRKEAVMHKPDAAISLIHEALNAGITAQYVLMDTWFTNEPFIKRVMEESQSAFSC